MFIVHAHHEPRSFNGAMTRLACERLEAAGHEVRISDLYAMGFDPISGRRNFTTVADGTYLKQQATIAECGSGTNAENTAGRGLKDVGTFFW